MASSPAPGDDMAWLTDYLGPNPTAEEVLAQIGALLIGNRTYQLAKTEEGKPYGGAWTGPTFVLTHDAPEHAAAGFTFVSGDNGRRPPRRSAPAARSASCVPPTRLPARSTTASGAA
jgi:hypothetical protein